MVGLPSSESLPMTIKKIICAVCALLLFLLFFLLPPFSPLLTRDAMRTLGILLSAISLWIGGVGHECAVAMLMCGLFSALAHIPIQIIFGAFNGSIVWIQIGGFILGAAMSSCGLLRRVALLLLRRCRKDTVGVSLCCALVGVVVAPFVPTKNAKGAIIGSVLRSVNENMGYRPKSRQSNALLLSFWTTSILMPLIFLSGSSTSIASRALLPEPQQSFFTTARFGLYAAPYALTLMGLMLAYVFWYSKPRPGENVGKPLDRAFIEQQLAELGPLRREERIVGLGTLLMVFYWIFKQYLGNIPDFASCLIVCALFWFTGCMSADEFRRKVPWENVIYIGICVSLGTVLPYMGITDWILDAVAPVSDLAFSSPLLLIAVLSTVFFLIRFVLISEGSFITLMCTLFLPIAVSAGVNPFVVVVMLNGLVSCFALPYQSSSFLSCYYVYGKDLYDTGASISYHAVFLLMHMVAMFLSFLIWRSLGVWYL